MRKTVLFKVVILVACLLAGLDGTAQLVDRATFDRHLAAAWAGHGRRVRAASGEGITLTQMPYEIDAVAVYPGKTVQVNVYFNTAVMAQHRSQSCPQVGQFDLVLPDGITATAVSAGSALSGSGITVAGNMEGQTLHVLGYGTVGADALAALPTGRIHYATLTLQAASGASAGDYSMTIEEALFCMADDPDVFVIDGTSTVSLRVAQYVTGVTMSPTSASVVVGNTVQLTATATPSTADNRAVTWTTSNSNVATVDQTGKVTGKTAGTATITATAADGSGKSATCTVTVIQLATGITLNRTSANIVKDKTLQLTATITPSNTSNKGVTWTSSNTTIATVNSSGLVTARRVGSCTVTATTQDGTNLSATCAITVDPQLVTGLSLSQTSAEIVVDRTLQLTATVTPSNADNQALTWTSSNESVATVNNSGRVTAVSVGTARITARTTDGTNISAYCNVTVLPQLATGISLSQTNLELNAGNSVQLTATVTPANTTDKRVIWSSSSPNTASVSSSGLVTANGKGECLITATTLDGTNLSATCHVTVNDNSIPVTAITLNTTEEILAIGSSTVLVATVMPENASNKEVTWSTGNSAVATISNTGVLRAVGEGETDITVASTDGTFITATCHVTVMDPNKVYNYMTVGDIEVVSGDEFVIPVTLINQDAIGAFQLEMYLPDEIEPAYDDNDQFVWLSDARKNRGHSINTTVTVISTRIMASSSRNLPFLGNDGELFYIRLRTVNGLTPGQYTIDLRNIILSTTDGESLEAPNISVHVGVEAYRSGDANGDGYIDDVDYVITVANIMGNHPNNFVTSAADMSGDGRVWVNDLPLIVNAAMNFDFDQVNAPQRTPRQASAGNSLYAEDFSLAANKTATVPLLMANATPFTAFQCDIVLPEGLSIVPQKDEYDEDTFILLDGARSNDHETWGQDNGNAIRVMANNATNNLFKGTSGAVATFVVRSNAAFSGEHEIVLKNIVCANADADRFALPDATVLINHAASIAGDVDGNGAVNGTDLNILINIILGKDNADNYGGRANVNGEGGVDGNDLNKLINIILGK